MSTATNNKLFFREFKIIKNNLGNRSKNLDNCKIKDPSLSLKIKN